MSLQKDLLNKLQRLAPSDRAWVVEHLSPQEKAQLLASVADEPVVTHPVSGSDPRQLAQVLKHEPAWLIAAVLGAQREASAKAVLETLPVPRREEIERLQRLGFGPALVAAALEVVSAQTPEPVTRNESAFARLVDRLGSSRSRKRLTLHL